MLNKRILHLAGFKERKLHYSNIGICLYLNSSILIEHSTLLMEQV